jgi:tetratricopeptide (TPR) repeat protein
LSQAAGLPNNLARSLVEFGEAALYRGAADEAQHWFAQAKQIARDLANDTMLALALLGCATTARWQRNSALARELYAHALELCLAGDQLRGVARARVGLAAVDLDEGGTASAHDQLEQALSLARAIGDAGITAGALEQRGRLAAAAGDDTERVRQLAEADACRTRHHRPRSALEDRYVHEAGHRRALNPATS